MDIYGSGQPYAFVRLSNLFLLFRAFGLWSGTFYVVCMVRDYYVVCMVRDFYVVCMRDIYAVQGLRTMVRDYYVVCMVRDFNVVCMRDFNVVCMRDIYVVQGLRTMVRDSCEALVQVAVVVRAGEHRRHLTERMASGQQLVQEPRTRCSSSSSSSSRSTVKAPEMRQTIGCK